MGPEAEEQDDNVEYVDDTLQTLFALIRQRDRERRTAIRRSIRRSKHKHATTTMKRNVRLYEKWRNESTETRKQIKASRLEIRALNREHKVVQNTTYRQYIDTFNENERVFSCLFNVWVGSTTGFSFDRFFVTTSSHVNVTLYIVPSALKAIPIPVVSKLVCSVIVHFLPTGIPRELFSLA